MIEARGGGGADKREITKILQYWAKEPETDKEPWKGFKFMIGMIKIKSGMIWGGACEG